MQTISSDGMGLVDVRDCALMHKKALEVPAAAGKRFISVASSPKFSDMLRPVVEKYGRLGWPVTSTYAPDSDSHYISLFNNTAATEVLGIQFRDVATTMVDMADSYVNLGIVTKP